MRRTSKELNCKKGGKLWAFECQDYFQCEGRTWQRFPSLPHPQGTSQKSIPDAKDSTKCYKSTISFNLRECSEIGCAHKREMGKENWINKGLNLRTDNVVFMPAWIGKGDFFISFSALRQPHFLHNDFLIPPALMQYHFGIHFSLLVAYFPCTIPSRLHSRWEDESRKGNVAE